MRKECNTLGYSVASTFCLNPRGELSNLDDGPLMGALADLVLFIERFHPKK
jgi:hypothetical protein